MLISKVLNVGDAQVAYRTRGQGPAIIFVNGTGGVDTHWGEVLNTLALDRTVVTLDYSGAGETSDSGGALTLSKLACQVAAVAEALDLERFDLVGHSLGAAVAITLAAEHPQMVRSLVLVAGFPWGGEPRLKLQFELWLELIQTNRVAFMRLLTLTALTPGLLSTLGTSTITKMMDDMMALTNWEGIARQVELDLKVDVREQCRILGCTALVIGCRHDQIVTQTKLLADDIPGAVYREINSGHQGYFEGGDEFLGLLAEFLGEQRNGALVQG